MTFLYPARSASLAISLFGSVASAALAIQVFAVWRTLKWEPESEWESSADAWRVDAIKVLWALCSAYFAAAATVSTLGFFGIVKNKLALVRFYRDYSIADFSFFTFFTLIASYAAFSNVTRAGVCEELSRHPELMRDVLEMGLSLENCEQWLERAVFPFVAFMMITVVVRLHFLIAVCGYHSNLSKHLIERVPSLPQYRDTPSHPRSRSKSVDSLQRIFILPRRATVSGQSDHELIPHRPSPNSDDDFLVYAPVPLSSLPPHVALEIKDTATEAWVSHIKSSSPSSSSSAEHRHHHNHHHRHHRSATVSPSSVEPIRKGGVRLPVYPDEGLLPIYGSKTDKA